MAILPELGDGCDGSEFGSGGDDRFSVGFYRFFVIEVETFKYGGVMGSSFLCWLKDERRWGWDWDWFTRGAYVGNCRNKPRFFLFRVDKYLVFYFRQALL